MKEHHNDNQPTGHFPTTHGMKNKTYMGLAERLALVSSSSVVQVVGMLSLHANVVDKRDVADLDLLKGPEKQSKSFIR